jgi:hypothetical protein
VLLFAFYFAGTMLGVDDNVIFLKFHPAIVRQERPKATSESRLLGNHRVFMPELCR